MVNEAEIVTYYEECNNAYRDAWGMDTNMQLNLGLWKAGTKNLAEALVHLNNEIAVLGKIKKEHKVLDAGCGVGGTAIHLAKTIGCHVTGITLTPHQVETAKRNAEKHGVSHLTDFKLMNYMSTSFTDSQFDIITGLESICYAEPKIDFVKEAFRILKKGGKVVLAENLQGKDDLTKREYDELYTFAFHGCKVESLDTAKQYLDNLKKTGFDSYQCIDYTDLIRPSIKRLRRFFYPAWAYNKFHRLIGKPFSETQEANTKMCYYLQTSLSKGLWTYGLVVATK
jgi:cyclopropane fatty-acyl-phospholipid synthase-like methyltransferase